MRLMPQHCAGPAVVLVSFGITKGVPARRLPMTPASTRPDLIAMGVEELYEGLAT